MPRGRDPEAIQDLLSPVGRAVVDDEQVERGETLPHPVHHFPDGRRFVESGDGDENALGLQSLAPAVTTPPARDRAEPAISERYWKS
jgi:hypothetical protein